MKPPPYVFYLLLNPSRPMYSHSLRAAGAEAISFISGSPATE
jgi:hypothetical protein